MAVVHIKPGGTKTATGAPDYASTADDWTDANCYDNFHLVGFNLEAGSPADYVQASDEIIFDSDATTPVVHDLGFTRIRDIHPGGIVTVKSKTGNADDCLLTGSNAAASDLIMNNNTTETAWTFEDITFTKSVTHTDNNSPLMQVSAECGDIVFTRVKWKDYTAVCPANTALLSNLLEFELGVITHRDVTFNDCELDNINLSFENGGNLMYFSATGADTMSLIFNGTNTFNGITIAATGADVGDGINGAILTLDGVTTTINGAFNVTDAATTVAAATAGISGFLKMNGPLVAPGVITGTRVTVTGGAPVSCLIHCVSTFTINEINSIDCNTSWTDTVNQGTSSCTFIAQTSDSIGTIEKVNAIRPRSKFGPGCYCSDGGTVVIGTFLCTDAKLLSGTYYGGGDGDIIINSGLITGTRQDATLLTKAADLVTNYSGIDIYCQVHETTAVKDKISKFNQLTILDSDPTATWSVDVRSTNATYKNILTMNNCVLNSGCPDELHLQEGTADFVPTVLNNCSIPATEFSGTANTFANNNPITSDPQPGADGSLPADSVLVGSGTRWWTGANPIGADGEPFSDFDTDVGGIQSTHSPFHPVNL